MIYIFSLLVNSNGKIEWAIAMWGVLIYVKDNMHYRPRNDLEFLGLEDIWIELSFKHKRVLFSLFYRPPNSEQLYYNSLDLRRSEERSLNMHISQVNVDKQFIILFWSFIILVN